MPFDPSKIRAILFDVDGTLADTDDAYIARVANLLRPVSFLFPRRDPGPLLRWGVMTSESPLNTLMGLPDFLGIDDELVAFANWLSDVRGHKPADRYVLMEGVAPMLERLARKYPLAVVTARSERSITAFLEQFSLRPYFKAVASAQTVAHTKPYPDPVLWAAQQLGVPAVNCLMIGDTTVDILAGKRAGAQIVGVLCGFGERAELEQKGADLILERTAQLGDLLPPQ
jgi:HAD superfamily hydrolase (TIGR01549 family)